ncbi:lycopene cyclase domain-containing protein [Microbacterium fluvii]|uniref:Lycopene cyclase domain-containing protein n=1 Tax=Microbacterium fluvii TaxID=415215 RepID=A0ABW2HF49_9MICO|nr:lycopene cyclase domain-containing protein [Microbacterium fluvii]MCU4672226.1 lycopene cyclase domain-containing protein [Microbacterium fluvii]
MPGTYLLALLLSAAGVALLDVRHRLAARRSPWRAAVAVAAGSTVLLAADAVAISRGIFVRGDSAMLIGIDLAPHLPLEEPLFVAFLSYLALVVWCALDRVLSERAAGEKS